LKHRRSLTPWSTHCWISRKPSPSFLAWARGWRLSPKNSSSAFKRVEGGSSATSGSSSARSFSTLLSGGSSRTVAISAYYSSFKPKLRCILFISSISESLSQGVPLILWPLGGEQAVNAALLSSGQNPLAIELLQVSASPSTISNERLSTLADSYRSATSALPSWRPNNYGHRGGRDSGVQGSV
jgi:hypothetical protein